MSIEHKIGPDGQEDDFDDTVMDENVKEEVNETLDDIREKDKKKATDDTDGFSDKIQWF